MDNPNQQKPSKIVTSVDLKKKLELLRMKLTKVCADAKITNQKRKFEDNNPKVSSMNRNLKSKMNHSWRKEMNLVKNESTVHELSIDPKQTKVSSKAADAGTKPQ